ncbi:MAG: transposase [Ardenticatenaceae bacterium]|nr:transposase [Ardenticatenaceae bacterium]
MATFFDYPAEIRRLIYTTNTIEGYNRQLRKVLKNKSLFLAEAARKPCTWLIVTLLKNGTGPQWIGPRFESAGDLFCGADTGMIFSNRHPVSLAETLTAPCKDVKAFAP